MSKISKSELEQMIEERVKSALESQAPAAPEPGAKSGGDSGGNPADDKPEDGQKAKKAPEDVQRKYSGIYVNAGAPKEERSMYPKGIGFARSIKCLAQAKGDVERAASIAQKMYSDDAMLHREMKAMSVTAPSDGGYLVPEVYANEVIELLRAKAVVIALGATTIPMPNGNMTIPKQTGGATAYYQGELRASKASKPTLGAIKLSAKKLITKVAISNDLLRNNSINADQLVLNDATKAMALRMDKAALLGKGGDFEPAGLLSMKGITKVGINAKPDEKITGRLMGELIRRNVDIASVGWAFNGALWGELYNVVNAMGLFVYREEMDKKNLNGRHFEVSNQLPLDSNANAGGSLIVGDWSEFLIGDQEQLIVDMFREGSTIDEDGSTISAIDHDVTIMRMISLHDFAVRHEEAFAVGENVYTK